MQKIIKNLEIFLNSTSLNEDSIINKRLNRIFHTIIGSIFIVLVLMISLRFLFYPEYWLYVDIISILIGITTYFVLNKLLNKANDR